MKIGLPVARFHPGNTGEYAQRALSSLGHEATILTVPEFLTALPKQEFEYFLCVDSSEGIPLNDPSISGCSFKRVGFWFIDYRHNKHRPTRVPTDFQNATILQERGGWIFQSQFEDVEDCRATGISSVSWLPLAADSEVWTCEPAVPKEFHIGFVGNIWDLQRKRALDLLLRTKGLQVGFAQGKIWKEEAAALMRRCMIGFNINTFFGEPYSYDINMRAFETLSCGVPLFTNEIPSLYKVFPPEAPFIRTYSSIPDMLPSLLKAMKDPDFMNSGVEARHWILENATYKHRMQTVLAQINSAGQRRRRERM